MCEVIIWIYLLYSKNNANFSLVIVLILYEFHLFLLLMLTENCQNQIQLSGSSIKLVRMLISSLYSKTTAKRLI